MLQRATTSVVMGIWVGLGILGGCRGESVSSEAAAEAKGVAVVELDQSVAQNLPANTSVEDAEKGRDLFLVCATCHGADASGTQLGPSLRDAEWIHGSGSFEEIQQLVRAGVPEPEEYPVPMPRGGGGSFDEAGVRAVSAYVYALSRSGQPAGR